MELTARFTSALEYATQLHRTQARKGGDVPYVSHLLAVAGLVMEHGAHEDEVIAALLHDAIEDQGGAPTREAIRVRFGDRVMAIVDLAEEKMKRVVDGRFTASDRTGAVIDVNPLNPARLTRRELLACGMSAIAVGCGGGTRTPTAPTPTDTPSTAPVSVTGQVTAPVSVTGQVIDVLTGGPVPDVVLQAGPDPVPVDAAGRFEVTLTPALVRLTVTAPGYVPRNTGLRVPGPHAVVSLIPVSFDLASFDVMCRTSWARGLPDLLSRWRQPFDLVLDRTVYRNDFGAPNQHVFLDDRISQGYGGLYH